MKIEIEVKTLVKFAVAFALGAALVVLADPDRTLKNYDMTANLNGTPVFVNTISDAAGATPTELLVEPGANILVVCTSAGAIGNIRAADTNAVTAKMIPCSAGEKVPLGFLVGKEDLTNHFGGGYVSFESAAGTTSVQVFRYY